VEVQEIQKERKSIGGIYMKPIYWVLIGLGASLLILGIIIGIPILWVGVSWLLLLWVFLGELGVWGIIGIIFLILKWQKKPQKITGISVSNAKLKAVNEVKMDEDNPDNLKIKNSIIINEGDPAKEKTKFIWISGVGTETNAKINVIMNLRNPTQETIRIDDVSEEHILEVIRKFAENPDEKTVEETTQTSDPFGRPIIKTTTTKSSSAEKKEQEEKEQAEKAQAL